MLPKSLTKLSTGKSALAQGQIGREHLNALLAAAVVPLFTVATLPTAATYAGQLIRVSDGYAGTPCVAISDGANWQMIRIGVYPTFTVGTLPAAATYTGQVIRVSNGNSGANTLAWSDGTNWKVLALGATCS